MGWCPARDAARLRCITTGRLIVWEETGSGSATTRCCAAPGTQSTAPPTPRMRPGACALVERGEVVFLVRGVHAVVVEGEADQQRVHAEHVLEIADDRDRTAGADRDRLGAPLLGQRRARLAERRIVVGDRKRRAAGMADEAAVRRPADGRARICGTTRGSFPILRADEAEGDLADAWPAITVLPLAGIPRYRSRRRSDGSRPARSACGPSRRPGPSGRLGPKTAPASSSAPRARP